MFFFVFFFQVFNIYTANGSVISPSSQTGSVSAQTGAHAAASVTTGVQVEATSHAGSFKGVFKYDPAAPYFIFPSSIPAGVHIRATDKQFVNQQGFAKVSK